MIKFFTLIAIACLFYTPLYSQNPSAPFTTPSIISAAPLSSAQLVSFKGSITNNKVILQWVVNENETADQFAVEKSEDGKSFMLTGLVFGSDKTQTEEYEFYEKANSKKVSYRIKLINKNKKTEYSAVIQLDPHSPKTEK
jgi:hypothetical protein